MTCRTALADLRSTHAHPPTYSNITAAGGEDVFTAMRPRPFLFQISEWRWNLETPLKSILAAQYAQWLQERMPNPRIRYDELERMGALTLLVDIPSPISVCSIMNPMMTSIAAFDLSRLLDLARHVPVDPQDGDVEAQLASPGVAHNDDSYTDHVIEGMQWMSLNRSRAPSGSTFARSISRRNAEICETAWSDIRDRRPPGAGVQQLISIVETLPVIFPGSPETVVIKATNIVRSCVPQWFLAVKKKASMVKAMVIDLRVWEIGFEQQIADLVMGIVMEAAHLRELTMVVSMSAPSYDKRKEAPFSTHRQFQLLVQVLDFIHSQINSQRWSERTMKLTLQFLVKGANPREDVDWWRGVDFPDLRRYDWVKIIVLESATTTSNSSNSPLYPLPLAVIAKLPNLAVELSVINCRIPTRVVGNMLLTRNWMSFSLLDIEFTKELHSDQASHVSTMTLNYCGSPIRLLWELKIVCREDREPVIRELAKVVSSEWMNGIDLSTAVHLERIHLERVNLSPPVSLVSWLSQAPQVRSISLHNNLSCDLGAGLDTARPFRSLTTFHYVVDAVWGDVQQAGLPHGLSQWLALMPSLEDLCISVQGVQAAMAHAAQGAGHRRVYEVDYPLWRPDRNLSLFNVLSSLSDAVRTGRHRLEARVALVFSKDDVYYAFNHIRNHASRWWAALVAGRPLAVISWPLFEALCRTPRDNLEAALTSPIELVIAVGHDDDLPNNDTYEAMIDIFRRLFARGLDVVFWRFMTRSRMETWRPLTSSISGRVDPRRQLQNRIFSRVISHPGIWLDTPKKHL